MTDIRAIIASGLRLNQEQDDIAYALLSPEEYYAIPDEQKPVEKPGTTGLNFNVQSLEILQNDWCVYLVNNTILGCCKLSQIGMIPDITRNSLFVSMIASGPVAVSVVEQFSTDVAAKAHYDVLAATGAYVIPPSKPTAAHTVRCGADGNTFPTVAAAAAFYALSTTAIYNSLRGKGNPRELNFERI